MYPVRGGRPMSKVSPVGCGLALGITSLLLALFFAWALAANVRTARSPEPPFPAGVPRDVPVLYGTVANGRGTYLVPAGRDVEITVEFSELLSLEGLWTGDVPSLAVISPYSQTLSASSRVDTWRDLVVGQGPGSQYATPWVAATLAVDPAAAGQWLTLSAALDLTYPAADGLAVRDDHARRAREVRLYAVAEDDLALVEAHVRWQDARDDTPAETLRTLLCPGLFLVGSVFGFIIAVHAFRAREVG